MPKADNFMVQAENAERMHRQMLRAFSLPVFKENAVLLLHFPEQELKDCVSVKICRVMRVETGHALLDLGDDKRVWMSKEDAACRNWAAYDFSEDRGFSSQSVPKSQ
jgi:hypothetical protein